MTLTDEDIKVEPKPVPSICESCAIALGLGDGDGDDKNNIPKARTLCENRPRYRRPRPLLR